MTRMVGGGTEGVYKQLYRSLIDWPAVGTYRRKPIQTFRAVALHHPQTQSLGHQRGASRQRRVLIVDDDRNLTTLVATLLRSYGLDVVTAPDGESALSTLSNQSVDAVVLDLRMPGMDGRTVFREMRSRGIDTPVLIASAYGARSAQAELGAEAAIEKPFDPETLAEAVMKLLDSDLS